MVSYTSSSGGKAPQDFIPAGGSKTRALGKSMADLFGGIIGDPFGNPLAKRATARAEDASEAEKAQLMRQLATANISMPAKTDLFYKMADLATKGAVGAAVDTPLKLLEMTLQKVFGMFGGRVGGSTGSSYGGGITYSGQGLGGGNKKED